MRQRIVNEQQQVVAVIAAVVVDAVDVAAAERPGVVDRLKHPYHEEDRQLNHKEEKKGTSRTQVTLADTMDQLMQMVKKLSLPSWLILKRKQLQKNC